MSYFMTRNPLPVKSRSGVSPQERGQTYTFDKENHLVKCVGLTPPLPDPTLRAAPRYPRASSCFFIPCQSDRSVRPMMMREIGLVSMPWMRLRTLP